MTNITSHVENKHITQSHVSLLKPAQSILRPTPIIKLKDENVKLFAKLEFFNGIGSVKDRPAFWILKQAIERKDITPTTTVIESSSGNFAYALAVLCKIMGIKFIPIIDPNISPLNESSLRTYCEQVVMVDERDDTGGFLKTRLRVVEELLNDISGSYWTNQYQNCDGMDAHYHLTANEIIKSVPQVDYAFIGVSTGGTVAGVSRRLKEHNPQVKIIAVDVEGSIIFDQKPKKRWISGLGSSIKPVLVDKALIDDVIIVSEPETISACRELLDRHGLFVGGSTGSVYSAIQSYFAGKMFTKRPNVVFLCCDRGTAYLHNIFDHSWADWRTNVEKSHG